MKPINTSTFDFPTLIKDGFVYVDKTRQIYELAKRGTDHIYFFPRPRRFGKSLLISPPHSILSGYRESGLMRIRFKTSVWPLGCAEVSCFSDNRPGNQRKDAILC